MVHYLLYQNNYYSYRKIKEQIKEEKKEVYRVVDSDIVRPDPVKIELPIYLL